MNLTPVLIYVIILNVNGLNTPIKVQRFQSKFKKNFCAAQKRCTLIIKYRLKKWWKKSHYAYTNQNESKVALLNQIKQILKQELFL